MSFEGAIDINICAIAEVLKLIDIPNNEKLQIIKTILGTFRHFNDKNKEKPTVDVRQLKQKKVKTKSEMNG